MGSTGYLHNAKRACGPNRKVYWQHRVDCQTDAFSLWKMCEETPDSEDPDPELEHILWKFVFWNSCWLKQILWQKRRNFGDFPRTTLVKTSLTQAKIWLIFLKKHTILLYKLWIHHWLLIYKGLVCLPSCLTASALTKVFMPWHSQYMYIFIQCVVLLAVNRCPPTLF